MSSDTKANLKTKVIAFVNQTAEAGPNPVSFNEFAKNNPDRKQIDKKDALHLAVKMIKEGTLRLVQDNDNIEEFVPQKFEELIDKKDAKAIIEQYSRFLARPDVLGASFIVENGTFLGGINVPLIEKISNFVGEMEYDQRMEFINQLNTYMVRFYIFKCLLAQRKEMFIQSSFLLTYFSHFLSLNA